MTHAQLKVEQKWSAAAARIIYLNGNDTGLKAYSKNHACTQMAQVIQRRGDYSCTPERLASTYTAFHGRVDFVWPS